MRLTKVFKSTDSNIKSNNSDLKKVVLVGSPNVGKSVTFNNLTGEHQTVSNYPGTTVDVARGKGKIKNVEFEVIDTPGMYSLLPITEEERVGRDILFSLKPDAVVHIVDAKNLERMLPLTMQLIEANLPVILNLNIMDEAEKLGIKIDVEALQYELGIPVVPTVSTIKKGMDNLKKVILDYIETKTSKPKSKIETKNETLQKDDELVEIKSDIDTKVQTPLTCVPCSNKYCPFASSSDYKSQIKYQVSNIKYIPYSGPISNALNKIESLLHSEYFVSKRAIGLLLLQGDNGITNLVRSKEGNNYNNIKDTIKDIWKIYGHSLEYDITIMRQKEVKKIVSKVFHPPSVAKRGIGEQLSDAMMNPITGIPLLLLVLYYGLYQFVGVFGAGTLVDFFENTIFGEVTKDGSSGYIVPFLTKWIETITSSQLIRELFIYDYGIITLGIRYAIAIVLPIVGTFFIAFSIIEDSGYLPRLAMLVDRVFKKLGLNGRAIIPIVLGFGCDTMATMVTRTLESNRERIIATLLLALSIPCSAQLGIILGILSHSFTAMMIWLITITSIFLLIGSLSAKFIPGKKPSFYMEVPPLRLPTIKNVITKTYTRMQWYLFEVLPIFIITSVLIWIGRHIKLFGLSLFDLIIIALKPVMQIMGLPEKCASAFLFGFFRRDYGAAGLYDLYSKGILTGIPLLTAMVVLTLFVPCIAQFLIMQKERGTKITLLISSFIFIFAISVGIVLNLVLTSLEVKL